MVMSSHQIGQMASGQAAMFGQFQSYAQQITPPYGNQPGMGYSGAPTGYSAGPPPMPPPMPAWSPHTPQMGGSIPQMMAQFPNAQAGSGYGQVMGERMMSGALSLGSAGISGLGTAVGIGGMVGMGASALGIGGAGMAGLGMLAGPLGVPIAGGLAAAGYGANKMMEGFQERQGVNRVLRNRFGGAQGIGSGRGGRGFSSQEMGGISSMLREMGTEDMQTDMQELTRIMDRTAQMGVYKGVSSAREFRKKFKETTEALKEIAQTMNTTLEGATEFMTQSRQMGFFSGRDISQNLMNTRMTAATTGMSVGQVQQIGQMGSQMGMSMGMRGRTGARVAQNLAGQIGSSVRSGALSDEQLFEATGGLQGAEGVQALTGTVMQANNRFLSRGAGRVLTAAAWDAETGGVNQEVMERIQRGEISFQEARRMGRRNIRATGGRRSEFFSQEERIRGEVGAAGGLELGVGMLESHLQRRGRGESFDDPIAQRFLRRQMGYSQSQVEAIQAMRREMPRTMSERRSAMRQEASNMVQTRRREGQGLQGLRRRWAQWWEREVENPIKQAADDMNTSISTGIEEMLNEFEGRIQTSISAQTKGMVQEWARTGKRPSAMLSTKELTTYSQQAFRRGGEEGGGFMADLGRAVGARGPGMVGQLRAAKANQHGLSANASESERAEFLQKMQRDLSLTANDVGVGSSEMKELGAIALDEMYSSMSDTQRQAWIESRGNKDKAIGLAKAQFKVLSNRSAKLKSFLNKGKNWYQKYALMAELGEAGGLGVLSVDPNALPGGGGGAGFQQTLRGAAAMQDDALQQIVELSGTTEGKERAAAGWGEKVTRGVLGALSLGQTELSAGVQRSVFGQDMFQAAFGRDTQEGAAINEDSAKRLLKNNELREDLRLARKGDKAARLRLTKASVAVGEGGSGYSGYGELMKDRDELRTMLDMAVKGTDDQKNAIDNYIKSQTAKEQLVLRRNLKRSAGDLSRFTDRNTKELRKGMGEDAFNKYKEIIELQQAGKFDEAMAAEKDFYSQYGGSKEGNFLLAHLRKGGVGEGMQEGLATMSDYTRLFRGQSGERKAKTLLGMTLGSAGVGGRDLQRALSPRLMRQITRGKIGEEELAEKLAGRIKGLDDLLSDRGISRSDFMQKLIKQIKMGKGGVDMDDLQKSLTGQATDQAWGARIGGAQKEETDNAMKSLMELRKTNKILLSIYKKTAGDDAFNNLATSIKNMKQGEEGGE